jgi:hypothetical protein
LSLGKAVGNIIHTTRIDLSKVDFAWMLGRTVDAYSFYEPCLWTMTLSGGGSMSTEAIWRVSSLTDLIASSTDHGHQFGLLSPVDAAARAREATSSSAIVGVEVRAAAPDLVMRFANGAVLEVLATSCGYECWQIKGPTGTCTVVDGCRNASTWNDNQKG